MTTTLEQIGIRELIRELNGEQLPLTDLQQGLLRAGVKILDEDGVREYQQTKYTEARWVPNLERKPETPVGPPSFMAQVLNTLRRPTPPGDTEPVGANPLLQWRNYPIGFCQRGSLMCDGVIVAPGIPVNTQIPAEGMAVMQRIADTGVEAVFSADQLDADPFLIVRNHHHRSEYYYIFAFDEHGYVPR